MTEPVRIAFLDRDGTLIETDIHDSVPVARNSPRDTVVLPGVVEGCRRLRGAGYWLVMVTNQPDIARGRVSREVVDAVNTAVCEIVGIDLVLVCPHDDADACHCRKPEPGLLLEGAQRCNVPLDRASVMIGDRWRDVGAGHAASVSTVLIGDDYGHSGRWIPDVTVATFEAAVDWTLHGKGRPR